jgi:general L-amino acid transport system substrate-binding protein
MLRFLLPMLSLVATLAAQPAAADTLADVKARGALTCGVNEGLQGFAAKTDAGQWSGFDVDFCRAVAAAIFNDASKVTFVPLSTSDRFQALKDGRIDLLARNSTWTLDRETSFGISFVAVTYYDGQGFLVRRARNATSVLELNEVRICVQKDTTTVTRLAEYFDANRLKYEPVLTTSSAESIDRYSKGECDAVTSDTSQLYAARLALAQPGDSIILPDIISREPLSPAVRSGDPGWRQIVEWVHFAMLNAEELGISNSTLEQAKDSANPTVRRLLGQDGGIGSKLGLTDDWVVRIVALVGNYREVFERNVGAGSKLGIPRGLNELWDHGGIQYAPPFG